MTDLPPGLYERLITRALDQKLLHFDARRVVRAAVDPDEAGGTLARHVERLLARALDGLPADERVAKQTEFTNRLIALLGEIDKASAHEAVTLPPEELRTIHAQPTGLGEPAEVPSPLVPLSESDLLVNARGEPSLGANLAAEIPSADSIDLLCAFVRWHGLRIVEKQLEAHRRAGRRLRVITTVYTGSTERKALDWLVKIGAEVKVSYDTESTRLHAKAWLFHRETGYSTAYIGSSNLSKAALLDGVEWNVRLAEASSPAILQKFNATFETYWSDADYQAYDPERDRSRIDDALSRAGGADVTPIDSPLAFFDIQPRPFQSGMLERLAAERTLHDRHKNLVVAATGTGKTVVAAFDFKRLRETMGDPTLLFVAHRKEILKQSLGTFRGVLRDNTFGELYVDGHRPQEGRHVFASVQSLAQVDLEDVPPDAFDVVIVDEFHHATASTYEHLLSHLRPKELLGLTATPERTDAEDVLHYFGGRIAVELRLWDALERGLLCPFQYFALNDETDLSAVKWSRKGYDVGGLENLYTANDARVNLVLEQLRHKLRDVGQMRALGFCVSIAHARFMADRFTQARLPAVAVTAESDDNERASALQRLQSGQLRAIFAVDVFNEGVDLPAVDTLLFLRPTESALVFMQQLGRGLRRFEGKDCVTVLDFIGKSHRKFRFDLRYRAITGASRAEVEKQVRADFPFLPAGCSMQLDRVAKDIVLANLRSAVPSPRPAMVRELRALVASDQFAGRVPTLGEFLAETRLDLVDVYKRGCWSDLKRRAGLTVPPPGPHEKAIGDRLVGLLHIDDPVRLEAYRRVLTSLAVDERLATGLHFTLLKGLVPGSSLQASLAVLRTHPSIVAEMQELLALLDDRTEHLTYPLDQEMKWAHHVPLSVHARHSTDDIFTGFSRMDAAKKAWTQVGIFQDKRTNSDVFLVTLEKSERDYSPTTRYRDYAITPTRFHWESQSVQGQETPAVQRYINHKQRGGNIFLFVRHRNEVGGRAQPYTFLGAVDYVRHQGEYPVSFEWELRRPMPADFFREAKVVAV